MWLAGENSILRFYKRQSLSLRNPGQYISAPAMGFNKVQIKISFQTLKAFYEEKVFLCQRIFNNDESGIYTIPNKMSMVVSL
jgi:hypothetical protein